MLSSYRGNSEAVAPSSSGKPILVSFSGAQTFTDLTVTGTLTLSAITEGSVLFAGAGGVVSQDNANFFWNDTNNQLLLGDGLSTTPSHSFDGGPDVGIYRVGANSMGIAGGTVCLLRIAPGFVRVRADMSIGFTSGQADSTVADTILVRDAANTLAQRNGTAAQTHNIYNTFTNTSNYERLSLAWGSNAFRLLIQQLGTGVSRSFRIGTTGASVLRVVTNNVDVWDWSTAGHYVPVTDNTLDIGATGTLRPRNIYAGTSIQIEADNGFKLTNQVDGAGAGAGTLTNAPSAGDPDFWLPCTINGTNHWIPAWAA